LDANHNPANAFLDETSFTGAFNTERSVLHDAQLSITATYTHSAQKQFRGFISEIANASDNAVGFRENIDLNGVYADSHVTWTRRLRARLT